MKILIAAHACRPDSGSEPGVGWNWVRQIARRHELWVITCGHNREAIERGLAEEPHRDRMRFFYTETPELLRRNFIHRNFLLGYLHPYQWMFHSYRIARRLAAEVDFEVAMSITYGSWRLPPLLHRLGIPLIWGPLGGGESIPAGLLRVLDRKGRAKEGVRAVFQRLSRFDPWLRVAYRRATVVLAVNRDTQRLIQRHFGRETRLFPHCGIEDRLIQPARSRPGEGLHLLSVARFQPRKGLILALEAFARARTATAQPLRLTMVGDGQERGRLERRAAELGLSDRELTFTGTIEYAALSELYSRVDAVLFPSLRDSCGMVLLEAMAAGLPVVCLDLGGPAEVVGAEGGIRIAAGDREQVVGEMAATIARLADDREFRLRLGRQARCRMIGIYGWDRKGDMVEELLQEVVARPKPQSEGSNVALLKQAWPFVAQLALELSDVLPGGI